MLINCDIGERGIHNTIDLQLMDYIDFANIACGGHAGDKESAGFFRTIASEKAIKVAAHLSYPDRENFGRVVMDISDKDLLSSLENQLSLLPDVKCVKLHGGLYNECCRNGHLAELTAEWFTRNSVTEVIAPENSEIAASCSKRNIHILREAFAERNYEYNPIDRCLYLVNRKEPHASIKSLEKAISHASEIIKRKRVNVSHSGSPSPEWVPLYADTLCIHSDSVIALELAAKLRELIDGEMI